MMNRATSLLLLQITAFWPVWRWYVARMSDSSDEPWGVLALLTALLFICMHVHKNSVSKDERAHLAPRTTSCTRRETPISPLIVSTILTAMYVLSFSSAPSLVRAILAMSAISFTLSAVIFKRNMHLGIFGLLILSLPLIASLQFYAGFPVRLLTCHLSSAILSWLGTPTSPAGTSIHWLGEIVSIDAPCSGIRMLWSGLYLSFMLSCFFGLDHWRTWFAYLFANTAIFFGNVVRAVLLFYIESGIVSAPDWAHTACGLLTFSLVASGILLGTSNLSRSK